MKARVTSRKYMGDDVMSWAVFVDGRPRLTGLTRREATYYVAIERRRLAQTEADRLGRATLREVR